MSSPRPHKKRKLNDSTSVASILPAQAIIEQVKAIYAIPIYEVIEDYLLQKKSITDILPRLIYLRANERIDLANYLYHRFNQLRRKYWLTIYSKIDELGERQHFIYKQFLPTLANDFKSVMQREIQDEHIYLGERARARGEIELAIKHFKKAGDYARLLISNEHELVDPQRFPVSSATFSNAYDLFAERAVQGDLQALCDLARLVLRKMRFYYSDNRILTTVNYPPAFKPDVRFATELLEFIRSHKPNCDSGLYNEAISLLASLMLENKNLNEKDAIGLAKMFYDALHDVAGPSLDIINQIFIPAVMEASFLDFYNRFLYIPEVKFYLLLIYVRTNNHPELLGEIKLLSGEEKNRFSAIVKKEYSLLINSVISTLLQNDPMKFIAMLNDENKIATIISAELVDMIGDHAKTSLSGESLSSEAAIPHDYRTLIAHFREIARLNFNLVLNDTDLVYILRRFTDNQFVRNDPVCMHHLFMLSLEYPGLINEFCLRSGPNDVPSGLKDHYRKLSISNCFDLLLLCDVESRQQTIPIVSSFDNDVKYTLAYTLLTMQKALMQGDGENRAPLPPELIEYIFALMLGFNVAKAYMAGRLLHNEAQEERLAHICLLDLRKRAESSSALRNAGFFLRTLLASSRTNQGLQSNRAAYDHLKHNTKR